MKWFKREKTSNTNNNMGYKVERSFNLGQRTRLASFLDIVKEYNKKWSGHNVYGERCLCIKSFISKINHFYEEGILPEETISSRIYNQVQMDLNDSPADSCKLYNAFEEQLKKYEENFRKKKSTN